MDRTISVEFFRGPTLSLGKLLLASVNLDCFVDISPHEDLRRVDHYIFIADRRFILLLPLTAIPVHLITALVLSFFIRHKNSNSSSNYSDSSIAK